MSARISQKDWERISAYLDGQLDSKSAQKLMRDIDAQPGLRRAYEDLQRYKSIVKQIPIRRARRNFTLTPKMVGIKPLPRLVPVFRLASAVIAAIAVILFAIDLLPSLGLRPAAAPKAASAPQVESPQATSSPEIIFWNGEQNFTANGVTSPTAVPGYGYGGGYGGGAPEPTQVAVAPPSAAAEAVPTEPAPPASLMALPPTPTVSPAERSTEAAADQAIQSGAESPILGIPPASQQGQIVPAPGETLREAAAVPTESRVLTFLGIGLLMISAGGGILSWVLARKARP